MPVRWSVVSRRTHKWLALIVGAQLVLWSLTGLYMTAVHIDTIHGDHLLRAKPPAGVPAGELQDPFALLARSGADNIRLTWVLGRPAYLLSAGKAAHLVDARSGAPVEAPSLPEIRRQAVALFAGNAPIASARLIAQVPDEIRGRQAPLWRVEFGRWDKPTFYLSPVTGELIARRHELWRVFDVAWMLHIMDYRQRDNVNNSLLRAFTVAAVLLALSGAWLLFHAFPTKRRKAPRG